MKIYLVKIYTSYEGDCGGEFACTDDNLCTGWIGKTTFENIPFEKIEPEITKIQNTRRMKVRIAENYVVEFANKTKDRGFKLHDTLDEAIQIIVDDADKFIVAPKDAVAGRYGDEGEPIVFIIDDRYYKYYTDEDIYGSFVTPWDRLIEIDITEALDRACCLISRLNATIAQKDRAVCTTKKNP